MNETPSREPGKPRFLAPSGEESTDSNYRGRFLGPDETTPPPEVETEWISFDTPGEAPVISQEIQEPETPVQPSASEEPTQTEAATQPPAAEEAVTEAPEEAVPAAVSFEEAPGSEPPVPAPPVPAADTPEEPTVQQPVQLPTVNTLDPLADFDLSFLEDSLEPEEEEVKSPSTPEEDQEFQELFHAEVKKEPEAAPLRTHPANKGRPRNRKGEGLLGIPNILVTIVWIGITLAIGVTLGRMAWVCAADVLAFGREDRQVTITISPTDTIDDVATKLHNSGLIRYPGLFKLYASFAVDEGEIKPGIWDLNSLYDYHALVSMMSPSSKRSVVTIMIPEGSSCRQVFELLQEKRVCTIETLEKYTLEGDFSDYWFLEDIDQSNRYCLEGYLFPDTYEFYTNDAPENVLAKMLNNFDKRVDEDVRGKLEALNQRLSEMMRKDGKNADYIAAHQFTMADVINVASLIEKESATAKESYTIASVIYNRLFRWGSTPAYLNIDAAVIYGLDGKTDLTAEDLRTDTPYNTYLHTGLTPGPITNPGLNSILAALEPESTDYYYYVLDMNSGVHHFSKTLEEHEAFRASNKA